MIDLLLFWSLIGGYVYMWLCTHREPPESKVICWLITIACGPGVWAYVIGRWWNEKMKESNIEKSCSHYGREDAGEQGEEYTDIAEMIDSVYSEERIIRINKPDE